MDDFSHSMNQSRRFSMYTHPIQSQYNYDYIVNDAVEDDDYDDEEEEEEEEEEEPTGGYGSPRYVSAHNLKNNDLNDDAFDRLAKRQKKMKTLVSDFELVPRSRMYGNSNSSGDWSDHEKFMLLEIWGERFLQLSRNSLRSEDWTDVAEKVSDISKISRDEAQCKVVMDGLKRKYKKEKLKCGGGGISKWPFFRKMDVLMNQEVGGRSGFSLACGVDSGEFVFNDTNVYLDRANGNDEMRDSPYESEEDEEEGEGSGGYDGLRGLRVLADSVQKFGEIYEKIESSKREQMLELEKMRLEFQRELEMQKKQILENAQAEIDKIREGDDDEDDEGDEDDSDDDDDTSTEDISE